MYFNATLDSDDGKDLNGYVALPPSGKGPGLILLHEVYGVTKGIQELADRYAAKGFVVAAPNMYWREDPDAHFKYRPSKEIMDAMSDDERAQLEEDLATDRDRARALMFGFTKFEDEAHLADNNARLMDTVNRVSNFLREHEACDGNVALTGFCFGARTTYLALTLGADVDAGVACYPTPELYKVFDPAAAAAIDKPLMFVVGGEDPYIRDDEKQAIVDAANTAITYVAGRERPIVEKNPDGNDNILTLYFGNNGHGFNRANSNYSDMGASEVAISTAAEFMKHALATGGGFSIPEQALNSTPDSPAYHPQPKV